MSATETTSRPPSGLEPGLTREERARALGECPAEGHCVLRAEDVRKSFHRGVPPRRRTVEVLRGASLMVCGGELDGGSVWWEGRLGYCPQQPMVWEKLTVQEHFELFARAYGLEEAQRESAAE